MINRTDRAGTDDGVPEGQAVERPPCPDPIPKSSPAEVSAAGPLPLAAAEAPPRAGLDTDAHWEKRDGEASWLLAHRIIGGKEPHPGR